MKNLRNINADIGKSISIFGYFFKTCSLIARQIFIKKALIIKNEHKIINKSVKTVQNFDIMLKIKLLKFSIKEEYLLKLFWAIVDRF